MKTRAIREKEFMAELQALANEESEEALDKRLSALGKDYFKENNEFLGHADKKQVATIIRKIVDFDSSGM